MPLISGGLALAGSLFGGSSAKKAAQAQAQAQIKAAEIAAEAAKFRPVGVTSRFGSSQFGMGPSGYLESAGYEVSPDIAAMREQLLSQAGGQGMGFGVQGLQQGQGLFNLGQQFLPTSTQYQADPQAMAYAERLRGLSEQVLPQSYDTQAAAQQYMQQQQALLQPGRERAQAGLTQNLFNTGRGGLAVAQGGMLGAANPEQQALLNAQSMQDLQLASQAQQQARGNLAEDIRLGTSLGGAALSTGTAADMDAYNRMLKNISVGQGLFGAGTDVATAGYSPMQTALSGASGIENLGQKSLSLGMGLGETATAANQRAAQMRLGTAAPAAQAQYAASSYSPWAAALGGLDKAGSQMMSGMFGGGGGGTFKADPGAYAFGSQSWD